MIIWEREGRGEGGGTLVWHCKLNPLKCELKRGGFRPERSAFSLSWELRFVTDGAGRLCIL